MPTLRKRFLRQPKLLKVKLDDPMSFQRDGRLHALAESVHARSRIEALVQGHLEPSIRAHLHGVGYRNGVLSLSFDSAAFSARLRYRTEDLSRKLRSNQELEQLQQIRCIVRPPFTPLSRQTSRRGAAKMSRRTCRMLHETASNFSDSEIRDSIQRLAEAASRRAERSDDPI